MGVGDNRRTGRTTRALQQAAKLALEGKRVFYVVPLAAMTDYTLDMLRKIEPSPAIVHHSKRMATYPGGGTVTIFACQREEDYERRTRGLDDPAVVVDHYFYEHQRMMAERATRGDRP